jgi:DNA mismatch repair protein MSH2
MKKTDLSFIGDIVTGLATTKLSKNAAETFLRDALLNKQQRVEMWKQEKLEWKVSRKASPGNLQGVEDLLFSSAQLTSAPVVIAVKYGVSGENKSVGAAFADTTINQLGVSEFIDNELYSNLEVTFNNQLTFLYSRLFSVFDYSIGRKRMSFIIKRKRRKRP